MRVTRGHVVSTLALIASIACQEDRQPTNPRQTPIMADWTPGPLGQPYTVAAPPWSNMVTPDQSAGIDVPAGVPIRITATGTLTFTVNSGYVDCAQQNPPPLPGGLSSVGPVGFQPHGEWRLETKLNSGAAPLTYSPEDPSANTVTALGQGPATIYVGRSKFFPYACGQSPGPSNPAYAVSGSQTVSVEALDSAHAVPDKQSVAPGDTVTFTVQVSWSTNFAVMGFWSWISDTTTNNSTFVSNCYRQNTCKVLVREKGHVYIDWVSVEGMNLTARSPVVTIFRPQFKVTAAPASITGAQSVTFTATVTPSVEFALSGWTWTPDSGTGGIAPNSCTTSEKTCTRTISKSGWMKATTIIGPYTLTDSAHVRVIPCPTGDSIADLQEMRVALAEALQASNVSDANYQNRIERAGMLLRNLQTGAVEVVRFDNLYADWCASNSDIAYNSGSYRLLGTFHTHPYSPDSGDIVPYCRKLEIDPATGFARPVQPPAIVPMGHVLHGGSVPDWNLLNALNQQLQAAGLPPVDEYIIDSDRIMRLDHGQQPSYTSIYYKACTNWLK